MTLLIFTALTGLFGLLTVFAVVTFRQTTARHQAAAQHWVETTATVIASSLKQVATNDGDTPGKAYCPTVTYRYRAASNEQQGNSPSLHPKRPFTSPVQGQAWLARHAPGTIVPVWYDPRDPRASTLEINRASQFTSIGFIVISALLTVFAGLLAWTS